MTKHKSSDDEEQQVVTDYHQAERLMHLGDVHTSFTLFTDLIERAPWFVPAYTGATASAIELGDFQTALATATKGLAVLDQTGPVPQLHNELEQQRLMLSSAKGSALAELGHYDEAIEIAKENYHQHPSDASMIELANTLALAGKLEEAEEFYGVGLLETSSPDFAMIAYNNMAILFERQGDFADALKYFQRAADCRPADTKTLIELGTALAERGHYDEALSIFKKVPSSDPIADYAAECIDHIGHAQYLFETLQPHIQELEAHISNGPETIPGNTYVELATHYIECHQNITAIQILLKGLQHNRDDFAILTTLCDFCIARRLIQLIRDPLKNALHREPHNFHLLAIASLTSAIENRRAQFLESATAALTFLKDSPPEDFKLSWEETAPETRNKPSQQKSYQYLALAGAAMKHWPVTIESTFRELELISTLLKPLLPHQAWSEYVENMSNQKITALNLAKNLMPPLLDNDVEHIAATLALLLSAAAMVVSNFLPVGYETVEKVNRSLFETFPESADLYDEMRDERFNNLS